MVTANLGLLLIAGFFIFEIGVYLGGEIEKGKGDKK